MMNKSTKKTDFILVYSFHPTGAVCEKATFLADNTVAMLSKKTTDTYYLRGTYGLMAAFSYGFFSANRAFFLTVRPNCRISHCMS
jgi:hypothetical protein